MAPHSRSTSVPCIKDWETSFLSHHPVRIILFVFVLAIAYQSLRILSSRRTTMSSPSPSQEKEKKSNKHHAKRVDSGMTEDQNQRLQALRQELSQQSFAPIHPWIAPPTPLPGPYDAPYYPLPMPTLRRYSHESSSTTPEKEEYVALTHHIPTPNQPDREFSLPIRGTTTVSNHGWKRTQWTIPSAG